MTIEMALYAAKREVEKGIIETSLKNSEIRFRELFNGMSGGVAVYETKNKKEDFISILKISPRHNYS